jgi:hypothetical protein
MTIAIHYSLAALIIILLLHDKQKRERERKKKVGIKANKSQKQFI